MSLENNKEPLIKQGWIRAISMLVVYVSCSVGASLFITSTQTWISVSFLLALVVVYVFRTFIDRRSFSSMGLNFAELFPDSFTGLSLGTFLICAGAVIVYLLNGVEWIDMMVNAKQLLVSAALLLMVAVGEELVFRGYVLRNLLQSLNKWVTLLISAVFFTLVHASNPGVPLTGLLNTFLAGLLTGITFMSTRNLWVPVLFHFSWNYIQGPLLGYPVSGIDFSSLLIAESKGSELISGGGYGFEGSVVCSIMLIVAFGGWCVVEQKSLAQKIEDPDV